VRRCRRPGKRIGKRVLAESSSAAPNKTNNAGTFTTATFKFPTQSESNTGSTETILVFTAPTTKVTASIDSSGDLSIAATVTYEVHITSPVNETCETATPAHVVLASTSPYTESNKTVAVKDPTITIPTFSKAHCTLASGDLDSTFSGPGGELGLTLQGTVVVPPPPVGSTTVLSATPASPQTAGTTVTLKATVEKTTGAVATAGTGSMTFRNGTTTLGTAPVSEGVASLSTKTLPVGTDRLTAVFSGGAGYEGSTSAPMSYVVQPKPTTGTKSTGTKGAGTKIKTCLLKLTLRLLTLRVRLKVCG
jgi:Bacterial Ig-like domain (group 3)